MRKESKHTKKDADHLPHSFHFFHSLLSGVTKINLFCSRDCLQDFSPALSYLRRTAVLSHFLFLLLRRNSLLHTLCVSAFSRTEIRSPNLRISHLIRKIVAQQLPAYFWLPICFADFEERTTWLYF